MKAKWHQKKVVFIEEDRCGDLRCMRSGVISKEGLINVFLLEKTTP